MPAVPPVMSPGIIWTAATALGMFALAWGKARTGQLPDRTKLGAHPLPLRLPSFALLSSAR